MDDRELEKAVLTMRIIWVSMLVSVMIYLFVIPPLLPSDPGATPQPEVLATLRAILYGLSIVVILLARFIPRRILSPAITVDGHEPGPLLPAVRRYSTAMVVSLALSEAVAIFGLVLFFLARDTASLYLLGALSLLSIVAHRPVRRDIIAAARGSAVR